MFLSWNIAHLTVNPFGYELPMNGSTALFNYNVSQNVGSIISVSLAVHKMDGYCVKSMAVGSTARDIQFSTTKFEDADAHCRDKGSHLLSVHSAAENAFAQALCESSPMSQAADPKRAMCWSGLQWSKGSGWYWSDNSTVDYGFVNGNATTGVAPWLASEPSWDDNIDEYRVRLFSADYGWDDKPTETDNALDVLCKSDIGHQVSLGADHFGLSLLFNMLVT